MKYCEIHTVWFSSKECPSCRDGAEPYLRDKSECSPVEYKELKKKGLVK